MKLALHWQIALWNAVLIAVAFLVFEPRSTVMLFAVLAFLGLTLFVHRLKLRVNDPLKDLSEAFDRAGAGDPMLAAMPRGSTEVNDLSRALREWSGQVTRRVQELNDSRLRLESVLGAMVEGVLVFDSGGRIVLSNAALRSVFEVSNDPLGRTCLEVFRNERLDRAVQDALAGRTPEIVEFVMGSGRVVRALVSTVPSHGGGIEVAVIVLQDLTDIRHVDRVRRDFVANVSHEFKTPLTSIRGYAETMLSESAVGEHREFVEIIHRNARYLESLVDSLLTLARIEAQPPSAEEHVDIRAIIDERVVLRQALADARGFEIEVDCPSIEVRADPARLSIALANLIDNAIRHNEPPGGIRITVRIDGPRIILSVSDEGFGIPEDELPRIFERFYRVDKARTPNGTSTGLGLAIARHAVEGQGGELSVESRVGKGSTFTIRLPADSSETADSPGTLAKD